MSVLRYFKKLQLIDSFIRRKATGNQKQFAEKVFLSRSMLNEYLKEMKELGFPIGYCKQKKTYYYEEDGSLVKKLFSPNIKD
jgi:DNA-binding IclR family transcriptional regulator